MVSIPDALFTKYKNTADDFIMLNFGVNCRLIYPARRILCANCVFDSIGQKSANRYKHGGPAPFNFGYCPVCGGEGYKEDEEFDSIKMRVYMRSEDFQGGIQGAHAPDADAQVIGFMYDLPKFDRANEIILNTDQENYKTWKFSKSGEAVPHGFKRDRYFMAFLKRV